MNVRQFFIHVNVCQWNMACSPSWHRLHFWEKFYFAFIVPWTASGNRADGFILCSAVCRHFYQCAVFEMRMASPQTTVIRDPREISRGWWSRNGFDQCWCNKGPLTNVTPIEHFVVCVCVCLSELLQHFILCVVPTLFRDFLPNGADEKNGRLTS